MIIITLESRIREGVGISGVEVLLKLISAGRGGK